MALGALMLAGPAFAATPGCETKDATGNCIPGQVLIDPGTGLPYAAAGGGGGSVPTGTAGSPNTSVVTVQGISGGTGVPVSTADGANVTLGAKADPFNCSTDTTAVSAIAAVKCSNSKLEAVRALLASTLNVGGNATVQGGSFTRPANTTAYAANQLYANSTTAGSVLPISAAACRVNGGHGAILAASLSISNPLASGSSFRLHIFKGTTSSPFVTTAVGDGGTWTGNVALVGAIERGTIDINLTDKGSDGAKGWGTRNVGSTANAGGMIPFDCNAGVQNLYVLIETLGAYTPTSGETATVALEVVQD
jgi:hypothetical protein